jgi:multiple sugar transport system permease protein
VPLSARGQRSIGLVATYLYLTAIAALLCFPLLWMISTSLKVPGTEFEFPPRLIPPVPQWSNYVAIWSVQPMLVLLRNSLTVALLATGGTLVTSSMVAFGFAWMRFPGRSVLFTMMLGTMMLPGIVTLVPSFLLFRELGWVDTYLPLIVPYWMAWPFFVFLIRQFYLTLPYELIEAARVDGAGYVRIWWQVMLPLTGPALAAVAIFSFVHHWNDFLPPLIYLNSPQLRTLALGLRFFLSEAQSQWSMLMTASVIMLVPVLAVFFSAQRYFIQGVQFAGLSGR